MKFCARHDHNHNERTCPFCADEAESIGDAVVGEEDIFAKDDALCADCGLPFENCECMFERDEDEDEIEELDFERSDRDLRFEDDDDY